jgi:hypothetical protein
MKKIIILAGLVVLLLSCGNNKADRPAAEEDSSELPVSWEANMNDTTGRLEMIKKEGVGPDSLSPVKMLDYLNTKNANIQLVFKKISGDTLYIEIPEASFLTRQMGSAGPTMFIAEVVYNLTTLPGINYVHIDFEEGDHAQPGTFTRDSFTND